MRWLLLLAACGPTPQKYVTYPATAVSSSHAAAGEWTLAFTEATVWFGPAYFCASSNATPELCQTALGEITETTQIDLLGPEQSLGDVYGLTGEVRSVMFDYGITWFTTQPRPSDAHSAIFRGVATRGAESTPIEAVIDIVSAQRGIRAVLGGRLNGVIDEGVTLSVTFDVGAWWAGVDIAELQANGGVLTPQMKSYAAIVNAMQASFPPTFRWTR